MFDYDQKVPNRLYKYCPLSTYSLRAISDAEVYHSPPSMFNDPLDCNPTIKINTSLEKLHELHRVMAAPYRTDIQIRDELKMMYWMLDKGPNVDGTEEQRREYVSAGLQAGIKWFLTQELSSRGVLSLSERFDNPLMWSHYGDQHRGICIGYDTTLWAVKNLKKVNYRAPRFVTTHDLYRWKIEGSDASKDEVYSTYFYSKAADWSYEKEWRDVSINAGKNHHDFKISEIYFGIRSDPVWKRMLVKSLDQDQDVSLFDMKVRDDSFDLYPMNIDRTYHEGRPIKQSLRSYFLSDRTEPSSVSAEQIRDIGQKIGQQLADFKYEEYK